MNEVISKSEVYSWTEEVNERGKAIGLRKMQIVGLTNNTYKIRYANLDGSGQNELEITRNPMKNFIQISFNGAGSVVDLEPPSSQWDLCFTKYTEKLYTTEGDYLWYGVTGPLLNPQQTFAVRTKDTVFEILITKK